MIGKIDKKEYLDKQRNKLYDDGVEKQKIIDALKALEGVKRLLLEVVKA
jgi:hypothetical protein